MNVVFTEIAWEDYTHWQSTDKKVVKKINELIKNIQLSPFEGIGQPEPLKHDLAGFWSRRISLEHRLVYKVDLHQIIVVACRYHCD